MLLNLHLHLNQFEIRNIFLKNSSSNNRTNICKYLVLRYFQKQSLNHHLFDSYYSTMNDKLTAEISILGNICLKGATRATGAQGAQGAQGPQGPQGPAGIG
jgi:hypothetical protein